MLRAAIISAPEHVSEFVDRKRAPGPPARAQARLRVGITPGKAPPAGRIKAEDCHALPYIGARNSPRG
jgi:hypothetical protein